MAGTSAYVDIPVLPEHVWRLIGGFGSLSDWLPFIPTSELEEGGRVRRLTSEEGDVIVGAAGMYDT
jgi:hypothetical protein